MAITSAFQAEDAGSIPVGRSRIAPYNAGSYFFYFVCTEFAQFKSSHLFGSLQNCVGFESVGPPQRSLLDFKEEVFSIPVTIGFPSYCLDHVVHPFNLPRGDWELGMVDDSHQVLLHRIAEREKLGDIALSSQLNP